MAAVACQNSSFKPCRLRLEACWGWCDPCCRPTWQQEGVLWRRQTVLAALLVAVTYQDVYNLNFFKQNLILRRKSGGSKSVAVNQIFLLILRLFKSFFLPWEAVWPSWKSTCSPSSGHAGINPSERFSSSYTVINIYNDPVFGQEHLRRSRWPWGQRRRSTVARSLRMWVRIPPGAWVSVGSVVCYAGTGLRNWPILRPEESYCVCVCVTACDQMWQ